MGEDFGFNPLFVRVPLAASVLYSPCLRSGFISRLASVVLASRLLFPAQKSKTQALVSRVAKDSTQPNEHQRTREGGLIVAAGFGARF